jgi:hypothetical protein
MIEFEPWPKIPRLFRPVTITEKIDGTNAAVVIDPCPDPSDIATPGDNFVQVGEDWFQVAAQSRKRMIFPTQDNYNFAAWVWENAQYLAETLGPGRHFGEWWGSGINRGYGMKEKHFSLFNVRRWHDETFDHPQLHLVPVLYHKNDYSEGLVRVALHSLNHNGSKAAPGYDRPEGLVVFHEAANQCFKVTLEDDAKPKGLAIEVPTVELVAA